MKYVIGIILLLVGIYFGIQQFKHNRIETKEISVMWDITDSTIQKPKADEIVHEFDFTGNNKWNLNAIFRSTTISDVSYNNTSEIIIKAENIWLSNEFERDEKIKTFQNGIINSITIKDTSGKKHSSVYLPIARELQRLSQSKSQKRILIVYSDLMENSLDLSFYKKENLSLLQSNPDSIKKAFESKLELPSLSGIEIHFVYQPADAEHDQVFNVVSEFYKNILESKGAKVTISANL